MSALTNVVMPPWEMFKEVHTNRGYTTVGLHMDVKKHVDPVGRCIYCMFQGSNGFWDWFHNLLAIPTTIEPVEGCGFRVHAGFNRVWRSGSEWVMDALEGWLSRRQFQDFKLIFTGFSHGGPLAVLATNEWHHRTGRKEDCIIFGSPKLAHGSRAVTALQHSGNHRHWSNPHDAIVHVPPRRWDFQHVDQSNIWVEGNRPWSILDINTQHQAYDRPEAYPNPLPSPWAT